MTDDAKELVKGWAELYETALAENERLTKENERLREGLRKIACRASLAETGKPHWSVAIARAALEPKP